MLAIQCYLKYIDTEKGKEILSSMPINRQNRHYRLNQCLKKYTKKSLDIPVYYIYKWLPKIGSKYKGRNKKKWERENNFATRISKLILFMDSSIENSLSNNFIDNPKF